MEKTKYWTKVSLSIILLQKLLRTLLRHEIARDMTFACSACNKKLLERVDLLFFSETAADWYYLSI